MVRTKNVDVHQREALSAPLLANANRVRAAAPVVQGIVRHIRGSATATPTSPCHFDSFDFEVPNSLVRQTYIRTRSSSDRRNEILWRWIITLAIAASMAVIAFAVGSSIKAIESAKYRAVMNLLAARKAPVAALLTYVSITIGLASVAALVVALYEPIAGGSGIPEIKCILNGLKIPRAVRFRTLFAKAIGITGAVSAGLPIGREGPMIHIGAVCGAGVSQGKSTTMGVDTKLGLFRPFRNDREKRDFIACGAAAGVACAFGAPVGGVLFAIEEGASFWNPSLTLRAFVTAMTSAFLLNLMTMTAGGGPGAASTFAFGLFSDFGQNESTYTVAEIPFFMLIGVCGGLLGALFNDCNRKLTIWRKDRVNSVVTKFAEVLILAALMGLLSIGMPLLFANCVKDETMMQKHSIRSHIWGQHRLLNARRQFTCPEGYYSQTATLFFNPAESAIINLFHANETFDVGATAFFVVVYYMMCCVSYGMSIPSGLFVPNLLVGAGFGRLVGEFLPWVLPFDVVNPGTYALIGAASVLGGMARMTISLTVILIEATGDIQYGLPLMLVLMIAKGVGDFFNEGLYDIHIHLKRFLFLNWSPPPIAEYLLATDIMEHNVIFVREVQQVREILRVVKETPHNAYPVVSASRRNPKTRDHRGSILRRHLIQVLLHKDFYSMRPTPHESSPRLTYMDLEGCYPRFPDVSSVSLDDSDLDLWVDLTPYMNPSPYVIQEHSPATHAFDLFRTMGLRHLCVVNNKNQITGMITRKNLGDCRLRRQMDSLLGVQATQTSDGKTPSITCTRRSLPENQPPVQSPYAFVRNLDQQFAPHPID
ncbi:Chloride channel protein [Plasmodiophora brassicae]